LDFAEVYFFANSNKFLNIIATAIGPMPPGTGVKIDATAAHKGSASPASLPALSDVPASMSTTPGFSISGLMSPGSPARAKVESWK